jgi:hypothetical protein
MKPKRKSPCATFRYLLVMVCAVAIVPGDTLAYMPSPRSAQTASPQDQAVKIPPDQLDSLVAPIALYPDPMLAQTLAASTYPLELIQLQQWLAKNPGLKDKALADTVAKQPWDPSIQALAALPEVVKRLADDIQWTTDLGNAFLTQQSDVMDAVQRMRKKAQDTGNLKATEQQKVETKVIENKSVIVVQQSNPQVVYVPSYDPVVVYGHRSIRTHRFIIRPRDTTRRESRFRSELGLPWGHSGAAVGAGDAAGVATTTSRSIATTISTGTRTLAGIARRNCRVAGGIVTTLGAAIARRSSQLAAEIPVGSTIRSIAAAPRMETEVRRTSLAARREGTRSPIVRRVPGNRLADRAEICLAIAPGEPA